MELDGVVHSQISRNSGAFQHYQSQRLIYLYKSRVQCLHITPVVATSWRLCNSRVPISNLYLRGSRPIVFLNLFSLHVIRMGPWCVVYYAHTFQSFHPSFDSPVIQSLLQLTCY
jgi:hypothetical protein